MHLSVIIPAYNEAERITGTLFSIKDYLSRQPYDWEVLVISDGSKDNTAEIVNNFTKQNPSFKLIDNKENHGKGYVVRQGMLEAKGEYRLFTDADNSTTIDHLERFWSYFKQGHDVVIASIAARGATLAHSEKFYKRWFGKLGNLWIQLWLLPGIWDSRRGFKMFTKKAAEDIFSKVIEPGWIFDDEALAIARRLSYKIKEVPIHWVNDPESKVKLRDYPKSLLGTLKIRSNLLRGKYSLK
ncbi:MAG: dolichyl-phosphate beta-glucosyltransferase [Patescibacteria group bacterium]